MSNNNEIISLGIIRLDYDYPPAIGDIDHYDTFNYKVYYKVIAGLTFEMCCIRSFTPFIIVQHVR